MTCSHTDTVRDQSGYIVCRECGMVLEHDSFETVPSVSQIDHQEFKHMNRTRQIGAELRLPDSILRYAACIAGTLPRVTMHHIAACIYASCIIHRVPRTEREIASSLGISEKSLGRQTSKLRRSGIIPATPLDVSTIFGRRLPEKKTPKESFTIQEMARTKYRSQRHVYSNVSVDTLITRCLHDAVSEFDSSHGDNVPRRPDRIETHCKGT